jgi:hypothetical protein
MVSIDSLEPLAEAFLTTNDIETPNLMFVRSDEINVLEYKILTCTDGKFWRVRMEVVREDGTL